MTINNDRQEKIIVDAFSKLLNEDHIPDEVIHEYAQGKIDNPLAIEAIICHANQCEACKHHIDLAKALLANEDISPSINAEAKALLKVADAVEANIKSFLYSNEGYCKYLNLAKETLGRLAHVFTTGLPHFELQPAMRSRVKPKAIADIPSGRLEIEPGNQADFWLFSNGLLLQDIFNNKYSHCLLAEDRFIGSQPVCGKVYHFFPLSLKDNVDYSLQACILQKESTVVITMTKK